MSVVAIILSGAWYEAKQAKMMRRHLGMLLACLEKDATETAQATAVDAHVCVSARFEAPPRPKRSRKRKVPDNKLSVTRSTRSMHGRGAEEAEVAEAGSRSS